MGSIKEMQKRYWKLIPMLKRYRQWKERRKLRKLAKFILEAKNIYDKALFGEPSERVTITWGKNKIGFDKPMSCSIEDALQNIVDIGRADERCELQEWSDADMPTMHIDDFNDLEKFEAHKKAMDEWKKTGAGLKPLGKE